MINQILALFLLVVAGLVAFVVAFFILGVLYKFAEFLVEKIANCFTKKEIA